MSTPTTKNVVRELFLLSLLSLFFELLIIRWMSADLRAFTVFRTFPLIACFVGLGVGFALRQDNSYKLFIPATMLFAVCMAISDYTTICFWGFPSLANFQWQNLIGLVANPDWAYVIGFALFVVLLLMGPFAMNAAIGSRLGVLFNGLPPLKAYSWNILGAIAGSIIVPMLSLLGCPPWALLLFGAVAIAVMQWNQIPRKQALINAALVVALFPLVLLVPVQHSKPIYPELLNSETKHEVLWSPYQRLDLATFYDTGKSSKADAAPNPEVATDAVIHQEKAPSKELPFLGLEIGANRAFYQYFFSKYAFKSSLMTGEMLQVIQREYALAFQLNNPQNALIVGAGTGQNVSSGIEAGVKEIDAVEIDPKIIDIGKKHNPDYHLPQVHLICDDARHYFVNCKKKYDVIDFSTLDSHAVSGLGSSVRVDMYVYTMESMRSALNCLSDNGLFICSFSTAAPWTKDRLYATVKEAAGYEPLCLHGKFLPTIFILGKAVKDGTLASHPVLKAYAQEKPNVAGVRILTDDWPYLYVRTDVFDYPYLLVVGEIIALSVFGARRFLFSNRDFLNWQMFFLGAAFMLLELHAITFLSLLYGATWLTSAIVITSILLMILAANVAVIKCETFFSQHPMLPYAALLGAVALDFAVPADQLLAMGASGHVLAIVVSVLPLAFAAFVFANGFKEARNISGALGFNLFGAVMGGLLEYVSSYCGIRSLLVISFALYACSLLCWLMHRKAPHSRDSLQNFD